ncbi:MAG: GFA family protein [Nisaea sp.]|uniref:GFA family protein n=1 Tax=Nisaea sp. TaxID=2024842 RepID=UPI003299FF6C
MDKKPTTGQCLCGAVKFRISGEFESFFLCHCSRCRKDSGSAHSANLFSSTAKLIWVSGEAKIKTFRLPGSRHMKSFCYDCGSERWSCFFDHLAAHLRWIRVSH